MHVTKLAECSGKIPHSPTARSDTTWQRLCGLRICWLGLCGLISYGGIRRGGV